MLLSEWGWRGSGVAKAARRLNLSVRPLLSRVCRGGSIWSRATAGALPGFASFLDTKQEYGYNIAIMRREIVFAPEAVQDLKRLSARDRSVIRDAIERHLRHEADQASRSRVKRLRGLSQPQYRLRVEGFRVFYDVSDDAVEVLAVVPKSGTSAWLEEMGKVEP